MEIKIKINDRLIRCVKGIFNRRSAPFMLAVVFFSVLVFLFADPFVIPYIFKTGEVISSSQMNANFEQLEDRINEIQTQVDALVAGGGSLWSSSAPDIYYDGGNVGIGTATPATDLEVDGLITAPLMRSVTYTVPVSGGTGGPLNTGVSTSTYEAFIGGISDQANVNVAIRSYWIYDSGSNGTWDLWVDYQNDAVVNVKFRVLFIRKDLFSSTVSQPSLP